jgi:tRNA nucleotidyltransferase (CCA-adding enzyme)
MASDFTPQPSPDFGQTRPGLGLLRMASLLAETAAEPSEEELILMADQVRAGVFADAAPSDIWPELALGLMSRQPSKMLAILRACGALEQILPEVAALFGVPDLSDGQTEVDLGEHLLCALAEAVLSGAPLNVRFALLVKNVGKADSPPEHLPSHYKHIERAARASRRSARASARRRSASISLCWRSPNASASIASRRCARAPSP